MQCNQWLTLPNEVWVQIFRHCSLFCLQWTVPMTCARWKSISRSNVVWSTYWKRIYHPYDALLQLDNVRSKEETSQLIKTAIDQGATVFDVWVNDFKHLPHWKALRTIMNGWYLSYTSMRDTRHQEQCVMDRIMDPRYSDWVQMMARCFCESKHHRARIKLEGCRMDLQLFTNAIQQIHIHRWREYERGKRYQSNTIVQYTSVSMTSELGITYDNNPILRIVVPSNSGTIIHLAHCCMKTTTPLWHFTEPWAQMVLEKMQIPRRSQDEEGLAIKIALDWDNRNQTDQKDPNTQIKGNTHQKDAETNQKDTTADSESSAYSSGSSGQRIGKTNRTKSSQPSKKRRKKSSNTP